MNKEEKRNLVADSQVFRSVELERVVFAERRVFGQNFGEQGRGAAAIPR